MLHDALAEAQVNHVELNYVLQILFNDIPFFTDTFNSLCVCECAPVRHLIAFVNIKLLFISFSIVFTSKIFYIVCGFASFV